MKIIEDVKEVIFMTLWFIVFIIIAPIGYQWYKLKLKIAEMLIK